MHRLCIEQHFQFPTLFNCLSNMQVPPNSYTFVLSKHSIAMPKLSLPSRFANALLPLNKKVFLECIRIPKSLPAVDSICFEELSAFSYRSSDMDK